MRRALSVQSEFMPPTKPWAIPALIAASAVLVIAIYWLTH
jgi:hypothetical protein